MDSTKSPSDKDRARGTLIGLAVGDALGAPVEGVSSTIIRGEMNTIRHFHDNFMTPKGVWTDDTSMALCLADSLLEKKGYDSYDIMNKFTEWESYGYRSYFDMGYGVGIQTDAAITAYAKDPVIKKNQLKTPSVGNGCIMRLAPIVIANIKNHPKDILEAAKLSARETHDSIGAVAVTELMAAVLYLIFQGETKENLLEKAFAPVSDKDSQEFLAGEGGIEGFKKSIYDKKGVSLCDLGGYAVDCFIIGMWGLINFDSFNYGLLGVIGLGGDTDTNGAVYGQLAGAYYGYNQIPSEWKTEVYLADEIKKLADNLLALKKYDIIRTRFEDDKHFQTPALS